MNQMNSLNDVKNSQVDLALSRDTIKGLDPKIVMESIPKVITGIKSSIEVYKKLKTSYYSEKIKWRDDVIKHEKSLVEVMNVIKDPPNKKMIADGIVDLSQKLLETAEEDLTANKSDNPFVKLMQELVRRFDLDGKRKFWLETFDKQKDILVSVLKSDIDRETEFKACKMMINYCDLLITGVDKLRYRSEMPKGMEEDYVSSFDRMSSQELAKKLRDTQSIRESAVNRIKHIRGYSEENKMKVDAEKQKITDKMLGNRGSKSEKPLEMAK